MPVNAFAAGPAYVSSRRDAVRSSFSAKLSAGALLLALADFLFYGRHIGWAAAPFALLLLGALYLVHHPLLRSRFSQCIALLLLPLLGMLVESSNRLTLALVCLAIVTLLIRQKRVEPPDAAETALDVARFLKRCFKQGHRDGRSLRRLRLLGRSRRAAGLKLFVTRLVLPVGFSLAFTALFSVANPVLKRALADIDVTALLRLLRPGNVFFLLVAGSLLWTLLRPRFRPAQPAWRDAPVAASGDYLSPRSIALSLGLFNLLFAAQNALDIRYLWRGETLPAGLSYAQYAHAGAYPLIVTALLSAAYMLAAFPGRARPAAATAALLSLWIAQNIFLVFSAIDRTVQYISIYSLTYLRLSALVWMGIVAAGLLLIVLRLALRQSNRWLLNMNAGVVLTVLYLCCFINFDQYIAAFNLRADPITEHTMLDLPYLESLGAGALPPLRRFVATQDRSTAAYINARAACAGMEIRLAQKLAADWRNWSWRRQRIHDDLSENCRNAPPAIDPRRILPQNTLQQKDR